MNNLSLPFFYIEMELQETINVIMGIKTLSCQKQNNDIQTFAEVLDFCISDKVEVSKINDNELIE